ncbi:MAG: CDGSH iron-sulfur domain-containing protein [Rhodothermales bacterium]|nr:CDGSH iron-sulfur domain-containing protein [Rhodothermales bacterium]MBO6779982.1 CDGSH iron-sulfur domain-containing protein [Rhodothermales bacterium]
MADKPHAFRGDDIDIFWDGRLCIHVEECVRARGDLFEAGRKPWAKPESAESLEEVTSVCQRCPTGALTYQRKDGGPAETAPAVNTVVVSHDGPLYLSGDLKIDGAADNMEGVAFRAALCRCGASSRKPFCDGSHEKAGFRDSGAVGNPDPGNSEQGGALAIDRAENGPLLVNGNFRIVTGHGRVAWSGTKAALCRCGQSSNKPFCDGTHRRAGFEAE